MCGGSPAASPTHSVATATANAHGTLIPNTSAAVRQDTVRVRAMTVSRPSPHTMKNAGTRACPNRGSTSAAADTKTAATKVAVQVTRRSMRTKAACRRHQPVKAPASFSHASGGANRADSHTGDDGKDDEDDAVSSTCSDTRNSWGG